jgi:hypothetical protein
MQTTTDARARLLAAIDADHSLTWVEYEAARERVTAMSDEECEREGGRNDEEEITGYQGVQGVRE